MNNQLKETMLAGTRAVGTFFELGNMNAMEALTGTGLDFVVIDAEHGSSDTETITDLIRAAESSTITPLVRIADVSHREIQRILDAGAMGLIVPCLRTMQEIEDLIKLSKYSPTGSRGFAPTRSSRWGEAQWAKGSLESLMAVCNRETLIIPQCETLEMLDIIEEVAKQDGVDGIFIGPYDLSIAMGIPGQFHEPAFAAAVLRIINAGKSAGKLLMVYAGSPEDAVRHFDLGIDGVAVSMDTMVLQESMKALVSRSRG